MDRNDSSFIKTSHEVISEYGIDSVRRWAKDSNQQIAAIFQNCLDAAGVSQK